MTSAVDSPGNGRSCSRAQTFLDVLDRISRLARSGRQKEELIPAQREALSYLDRANRFSRTPGAFAKYLGATKGTVSQTLIALERRGFVAKIANPTDARSVQLELTDTGRTALHEAPVEGIARALQSLSKTRRAEVDEAFASLLSAIVAETGRPAFGVCRTCRFFEAEGRHDLGGPHRCMLLDVPLSAADSALICAEQQS